MSMLSRFATQASSTPAAVQYVGGTSAQVTGSTATTTNVVLTGLTGGLASAPADGDLVIVYYGAASTADRALTITTAGYTQVADLYANDTYDANLTVAYKRMTSTPDTSVDVSATGATADGGAVAVHVWRGVDSLLPFEAATATATGINTVLCAPPAVTPVTTGAVIIAGGAGAHSTTTARTYTSSDLTNFVTRGSPNSTNDATVGVGSKAWTSGTFTPATFGFSGTDSTSYSWAAVTLILFPAQTSPAPFAISKASTQTGTASTLVINKPTGTREGDLMVAFMNAGGGITWTGDTDWTEVAEQASTSPSTRIAYKVAGASEGASYTFTASTTTNLSGTIATYRNAAYDAVGAITSGTSTLSLAAVTTSVPYGRVLGSAARALGSVTITGPASMQTLDLDADSSLPSRLVAQDTNPSPKGSSGTRAFVMGASTSVSGALVAVKPAASYTKYANYTASNSASNTNTTTVAVNTPSAVPGNLLLFVVSVAINTNTDVTVSTPSGWTLLSGNSTATTSYQPGMYVFYRVADGSETISYTATASTSCQLVAAIVALGGVDNTTLTAGTTNTGSATTAIAANAVTATANGVLLYFGAQANNNQGAPTFTPASGMTEAQEVSVDATGIDFTLEVAYQEALSAGSTGNKTATSSSSAGTNRFRAILVTVGAK